MQDDQPLFKEGFQRAVELLHECVTKHGFVAAPRHKENYRQVWARDGVIMGLAALLTADRTLCDAFRATLVSLSRHLGPNGEVPSHIDPEVGMADLGYSVGRVDSNPWFIIGVDAYWRTTGDRQFLDEMLPACDRVRGLLHAWEFNDRGLIYVPQTGDWADEFIHDGYVLYDQVLYQYAQQALSRMYAAVADSRADAMRRRAERLAGLIRDSYWIEPDDQIPREAYDRKVYEAAVRRLRGRPVDHWLSSFSPYGYTFRFDGLANVLVALLGGSSRERSDRVDAYIARDIAEPCQWVLPSFWPAVAPGDADWKLLTADYSYEFKNTPHHYQNGGLWPMITGFHVADLAQRGKRDSARRFLEGLHRANRSSTTDKPWGFPEYVAGDTHEPGGTQHIGWSAAGAVIGQKALEGRFPFSDPPSIQSCDEDHNCRRPRLPR